MVLSGFKKVKEKMPRAGSDPVFFTFVKYWLRLNQVRYGDVTLNDYI